MNSRLFQEARKSKVLPNSFFAVIIMMAMMIVGQFIGGTVMVLIIKLIYGPHLDRDVVYKFLSSTSVQLFSFVFPLLACFLWVKFIEKRKIRSLGLEKDRFFLKFLKGFGIGFFMFSLVTLLMVIFKVAKLEEGIGLGLRSIKSIIAIITFWIIQSSTEEILSRGWLMHVVGAKYRPMTGFIISSILFGLLHIFNPGVSVLSIVNIILVGFMFGLYVIITEDLWGVCGIHAAWNFAQGNIYGFKVSGSEVNADSLIKLSSQGSPLLTGGAFGPEGSIFASLVSLGFILVLVHKIKKD